MLWCPNDCSEAPYSEWVGKAGDAEVYRCDRCATSWLWRRGEAVAS